MKKLLLFLFILINVSIYAQVNDIINCANNSNFNLTIRNTELIGNLNPNQTVISFHLTLVDATNNTNSIVSPANYVQITSPQLIFARINNLGVITTNYFSLIQSNPLTTTAIISSPLTCLSEASITATAIGGTAPYTYSLINSNGFFVLGPTLINTFNGVTEGNYIVSATDSLGCTSMSNQIVITNPSTVVCSAIVSGNTVTINASGGSPPYIYEISLGGTVVSNFSTSNFVTNLPPGVYLFNVRDINGCLCTNQVVVQHPTIDSNNDAITIYPSNIVTSTSSVSVLDNDYLYMNLVSNNVALTPISVPIGFNLNANGTISVLAGTAPGTYTIEYQICENANMNICDISSATVTISQNGIVLKAFIDSNANTIQDNGEVNFTQGQFGYILNDNGVVNNVSSSNGEYLINESNPLNSYDLNFTINPAYTSQYSLTTSSYSNVSVPNSGVATYSFPVTAIPFKDLLVSIYASGTPPRPGFTYSNQIMYRNEGNETIASGTINFTNSNAVIITNISQSGTMPIANGFTYDFINLLPGESRFINVTMQVPTIPTVNLGQLLTNFVTSSGVVGDITSSNNEASLSQIIVGSYDPNDKTESHGGKILHSTFTPNDYLMYTIQFENTGTYNAENVRVNDVLDAKLDETSIIMVKSSHNYELSRIGNNVNWNFNGIELPKSLANTQIGHGFITFQIKPKPGYAVGDIILNTADIFFDFNPAIVTNTFNTEFVSTLGVLEFEMKEFRSYPNPTNGLITISLKNNTDLINSVIINDISGKTVVTKTVNNLIAKIDLSNVSKGIYFVKVKINGLEKVIKVVKE